MEQFFQDMTTPYELNHENRAPSKSWKSKSNLIDEPEKNCSGGFDCNICLDSVNDPVVTFCGHLYCWPCIYKWIHADKPDNQEPQCPVCKVGVSEKTLIPLYGPGLSTKSSDEKAPSFGIVIPQRPQTPKSTSRINNNSPPSHQRSYPHPNQEFHPYPSGYVASPRLNLGGARTNIGLGGEFGEMVYSRIFGGNSETTLYTYPNSYNLVGNSTPRLRRHVMEVDKSLSRISFFLFCCMMLCLVLF